ncbi:acyltransferase family protein [Reyranella soli]|uniref:Acyltransferase n=1 Tax=Reyranella soli TaxID=1230389 RepID=A0A512NSC5_9HYPH|nr:acyltransferase family protein [Reyranella soli]GEP61868.1 acyltransferase [Reyranella soli]
MSVSRRADLDWLRVLAFGLLIAYHAGMAWSGWSWHLTSADSIDWLREGMRFVNRWRMPLIFLVSGAAIMLALGSRTPAAFARDRVKRLLLPLAFGMVVIVPPQIYLERLYRGQFTGSFFDWLPQAFQGGPYPNGNVSWHHLWFLAYVLVLTFVLLPCFLWARSPQGRHALDKAGRLAARFGLQWLMVLPLAASILWLAPVSYNTNGLIGDWHGLVYYGALLLYGAFLFGSSDMLQALNRQRWLSFAVGAAAYGALYDLFFHGTVRPTIADTDRAAFALLSAVNTMAWLFAITGFANRHLTKRPAFLGEATEAVYPFYILHQTVTVIAVYWLLQIGAPPVAGFILAVLATFIATSAIYFGLVRPLWFLRPLFGLKLADRRAIVMSRQPG